MDDIGLSFPAALRKSNVKYARATMQNYSFKLIKPVDPANSSV